jgi:hypothetical protein
LIRLAVLAAALASIAAAPLPEKQPGSGDPRSAVERHWLAYSELQLQKVQQPQ